MRLVSELHLVCEQLRQVIDRVVRACVTIGTVKNVFSILVYLVANGTELVVGHAAFGRPHPMTVRASHFLLLKMLPMGELESPVCADLRVDLGTGLRTGLRTGPRAGLPNGPQAHERNQPDRISRSNLSIVGWTLFPIGHWILVHTRDIELADPASDCVVFHVEIPNVPVYGFEKWR